VPRRGEPAAETRHRVPVRPPDGATRTGRPGRPRRGPRRRRRDGSNMSEQGASRTPEVSVRGRTAASLRRPAPRSVSTRGATLPGPRDTEQYDDFPSDRFTTVGLSHPSWFVRYGRTPSEPGSRSGRRTGRGDPGGRASTPNGSATGSPGGLDRDCRRIRDSRIGGGGSARVPDDRDRCRFGGGPGPRNAGVVPGDSAGRGDLSHPRSNEASVDDLPVFENVPLFVLYYLAVTTGRRSLVGADVAVVRRGRGPVPTEPLSSPSPTVYGTRRRSTGPGSRRARSFSTDRGRTDGRGATVGRGDRRRSTPTVGAGSVPRATARHPVTAIRRSLDLDRTATSRRSGRSVKI
jgi:hypothetical protein